MAIGSLSRTTIRLAALAFVASWICGTARAESPWLWPVDGEPRITQLAGRDDAGHWLFENAGATWPLGDEAIYSWGRQVFADGKPRVWLFNGSMIVGDVAGMDVKTVTVRSGMLDTLTLDRAEVRAILLGSLPGEPALQMAILRTLTNPVKTDSPSQLAFSNGDHVAGDVESIDSDVVMVRYDNRSLTVRRDQVLWWRSAGRDQERAAATGNTALWLRDGSRIIAQRIIANDDETMTLNLGADGPATTPIDLRPWWKQVVCGIERIAPPCLMLSDLAELNYRHQGMFQVGGKLGRDTNAVGGPLRVGDFHSKGLGVRSLSRITLTVDPSWRRFQAWVGVDDEAGQEGSVEFRVLTYAGQGGWQSRFHSDVLRAGLPAVPVSVDLAGVERLALVVEPADRGDVRDLADWLEARVMVARPNAPPTEP